MISHDQVLITTALSFSQETRALAEKIAMETGLEFVSRDTYSIRDLLTRYNRSMALVVGVDRFSLINHDGTAFRYHPNMAILRVRSLISGHGDKISGVLDISPGDTVLDCTCGMASDATVISYLVGEDGTVMALEASPLLAVIVKHSLGSFRYKNDLVTRAMRRIVVENATYQNILPKMASRSWDIVYFDPMFTTSIQGNQSFNLVRMLGSYQPLQSEHIEEALRVAKRCVVVKDRAPGRRLVELGIPIMSRSKRVFYGKLAK